MNGLANQDTLQDRRAKNVFLCQYCNKMFATKQLLQKHTAVVHQAPLNGLQTASSLTSSHVGILSTNNANSANNVAALIQDAIANAALHNQNVTSKLNFNNNENLIDNVMVKSEPKDENTSTCNDNSRALPIKHHQMFASNCENDSPIDLSTSVPMGVGNQSGVHLNSNTESSLNNLHNADQIVKSGSVVKRYLDVMDKQGGASPIVTGKQRPRKRKPEKLSVFRSHSADMLESTPYPVSMNSSHSYLQPHFTEMEDGSDMKRSRTSPESLESESENFNTMTEVADTDSPSLDARARRKRLTAQQGSSVIESYICIMCSREFTQSGNFRSHMKQHRVEDGLQCKCGICHLECNNDTELLSHMTKAHTGEDPYKCSICDRSFTQYNNLRRHLRVHNGNSFKCTMCDQEFSEIFYLEMHMGSHTGERIYKCGICNMPFHNKGELNFHILTHPKESLHTCSECGKSFSKACILRQHKKKHSGERPYKCDVCEKSFVHRHHLTLHMRSHSGPKPFICNLCGKSFAQSGHLNQHQQTSHSEIFLCSSDSLIEPGLARNRLETAEKAPENGILNGLVTENVMGPSTPQTPIQAIEHVEEMIENEDEIVGIVEPAVRLLKQEDECKILKTCKIKAERTNVSPDSRQCDQVNGKEDSRNCLTTKHSPLDHAENECGMDSGIANSTNELCDTTLSSVGHSQNNDSAMSISLTDNREDQKVEQKESSNLRIDEHKLCSGDNQANSNKQSMRMRTSPQEIVDGVSDSLMDTIEAVKKIIKKEPLCDELCATNIEEEKTAKKWSMQMSEIVDCNEVNAKLLGIKKESTVEIDKDIIIRTPSPTTRAINDLNENGKVEHENLKKQHTTRVTNNQKQSKTIQAVQDKNSLLQPNGLFPNSAAYPGNTFPFPGYMGNPAIGNSFPGLPNAFPFPGVTSHFQPVPENWNQSQDGAGRKFLGVMYMSYPVFSGPDGNPATSMFPGFPGSPDMSPFMNNPNFGMFPGNQPTFPMAQPFPGGIHPSFPHNKTRNDSSTTLDRRKSVNIPSEMNKKSSHIEKQKEQSPIDSNAVDSEKKNEQFLCDLCGKYLISHYSLTEHLETHRGYALFKCGVCDRAFLKLSVLLEHMSIHPEKKYKCGVCSQEIETQEALGEHIKGHDHMGDATVYACSMCDEGLADKDQYKKHIAEEHSPEQSYKCHICQREFSRRNNLQRHIRSHSAKLYECDLCGRQFNETFYLEMHRKIHTNVHKYKCESCDEEFSERLKYLEHMKKHAEQVIFNQYGLANQNISDLQKEEGKNQIGSNENVTPCSTSMKKEDSDNSLQNEIDDDGYDRKLVIDELSCNDQNINQPFERPNGGSSKSEIKSIQEKVLSARSKLNSVLQCNICKLVLGNPRDLQIHLGIHTGQRPHICDVCGKGFAKQCVLYQHKKIHGGHRPHKCEVCAKTFIHAHHLSIHRRVHTGDCPFKCHICKESFKHSGDYRKHMLTHRTTHQEKPVNG
ncbi:hypothetical protein ScPMuIL_003382 [Solemya velum]